MPGTKRQRARRRIKSQVKAFRIRHGASVSKSAMRKSRRTYRTYKRKK